MKTLSAFDRMGRVIVIDETAIQDLKNIVVVTQTGAGVSTCATTQQDLGN